MHTLKSIQFLINELNELCGYDTKTMSYDEEKKRWFSNPNVFYIDKAYGGYRLCQNCSNGKGAKDISIRTTKKVLYYIVDSMVTGFILSNKVQKQKKV